MGDSRVKELPKDNQRAAGQDDPTQRLRDDAYGPVKRDGSDKATKKPAGDSKFNDPYDHMHKAASAVSELQSLTGKKDTDKVSTVDAAGKPREVTVGQRREELFKTVETEFNRAMKCADNIDQNKVATTLVNLRGQIAAETDPQKKEKLERQETAVEAMKHAPSITRFSFATFLSDGGDYKRAKDLLDQAAKLDPEARHDKYFQKVSKEVSDKLTNHQDNATVGENPFQSLKSADDKRTAGDVAGADADYQKAIAQADKLNGKEISDRLAEIEKAEKDNAKNPKALEELNGMEQGLSSLAHAPAIARLNYADFLNQQKRYDEALPLLMNVAKSDPELVKSDKDFAKMVQVAQNKGKDPEPFDDPFAHLSKFKESVDKGDLTGAKTELEKAVRAGDKVDRKLMESNIAEIDKALKAEKDPAKIKGMQDMRNLYDQLDHAGAMGRVALARFDIASKNYGEAQSLLSDVQKMDPEFANRPAIDMPGLLKSAEEPSTWSKIGSFAVSALKELSCDAVAVLAGAGAVVGFSLTGPGAVVAGGLAGAAAYTGMKALWGDEIHWYTPLWGAVDGVTGGTAALARTALVEAGGKLITKEMAAGVVTKTGGKVAALEGMEGMKMAQTAQVLAKEGLKDMAKDVPFWARQASKIPFIGAGNAEFRTALAAFRGLKYANLGTRLMVDAGTIAAGSAVYRGAHEGYNYYKGDYKSVGEFAQHYVGSVGSDTLAGTAWLGPAGAGMFAGSTSKILPFFMAEVPVGIEATKNYLDYKEATANLEYLQKPLKDIDEYNDRESQVPGTSDIDQNNK